MLVILASYAFAQFEIPLNKIVKDSVDWECCFAKESVYFIFVDKEQWTFEDYHKKEWQCCFIDKALRRYEMLQIKAN